MEHNILFAGFGGQGIQFVAKVTAYSAMVNDQEVSFLPSYGPEMRGGTSNCAVRISDKPIACPIVNTPNILVALNEPSYDKFHKNAVKGSVILYDNSLFTPSEKRDDVSIYGIPATRLAKENGLEKSLSIIALGYLTKKTDFLPLEAIKAGLDKAISAKTPAVKEMNIKALEMGYNLE